MEREPLVVYFKQQKAKLSHRENPDNKFPSVSLSKQPYRKSEVSEERRKNQGATELPWIKHILAGLLRHPSDQADVYLTP